MVTVGDSNHLVTVKLNSFSFPKCVDKDCDMLSQSMIYVKAYLIDLFYFQLLVVYFWLNQYLSAVIKTVDG